MIRPPSCRRRGGYRRALPASLLAGLLASLVVACGASNPRHRATEAVAAPGSSAAQPTADRGAELTRPMRSGGAAGNPGTSQAPFDGRRATDDEERIIDRLLRSTESVRGLRFARPVESRIQSGEAIARHMSAQIEEDDVTEAGALYGALGLLPPHLDLRALFERLLSEQVLGYYDPEAGRLVIRDDVMAQLGHAGDGARHGGASQEALVVIVHELVHALQDQRLGLGQVIRDERDTDADNAFHAAVEGDATLAMLGFAAGSMVGVVAGLSGRPEVVRNLLADTQAPYGSELEAAPAILRIPLTYAYIDGMLFHLELYRRRGWAAVDGAHRRRPTSTEQILHPERYLANEAPEAVAMPPLDAITEDGFELLTEDTLGELELSVYFGQGLAAEIDRSAGDGWAGDRLRLYHHPGTGADAVVWLTRWDDTGEAREAEQAAQRVIARLSGTDRVTAMTARRERTVLIVRGLPNRLHRAVLAAAFGHATGTRGQARPR